MGRPASATGADYSGRHGDRAVSVGIARWTTLGADVLRADRWTQRRDVHHVVTRSGDLCDLRARSEVGEVGKDGGTPRTSSCHCLVS